VPRSRHPARQTVPIVLVAFRSLVLLACAALPAVAVETRAGSWTPIGPGGGTVTALAASPAATGTAYATTLDGSVYRTADGGVTWLRAGGLGPPQTNDRIVSFLLPDSTDADHLYAVTGTGIWQTRDGGASWLATPLQDDNATYQFLGAAIAPSAPRNLYGSDPNAGIWRSGDGGATWAQANGGLPFSAPFYPVQALAVDPADANTAYLGTSQGQIFKTTDGGGSWTRLATLPGGKAVLGLALDPSDRRRLYASGLQRVSTSADGGATWTPVDPDPGVFQEYPSLAVDAATGAVYAAARVGTDPLLIGTGGVYRSADFGATWKRVLGTEGFDAVAADPGHPARVYAGSGVGIAKSEDGGSTWADANRGVDQVTVTAFAADPHTPGTLYAAVQTGENLDLGIARSRDGGATWAPANAGLAVYLSDIPIYQIVVDPRRAGALYALTGGGLFKSADGGGSWRLRDRGLPQGFVPYDLAMAPGAAPVLYLAGSYDRIVCSTSDNCGLATVFALARSADGGTSWVVIAGAVPDATNQLWTAVAVDPAHPGSVYAESYGLWKSADFGATWVEIGPAAPVAEAGAGLFELGSSRRLRVDPSFPNILYESSGGPRQIYRSNDGGATHKRVIAGIPLWTRIHDLLLDPRVSSTLYAATDLGALVSANRGKLWQPLTAGPQPAIGHLAADPFAPGTLYGAGPRGLFVFTPP
jgi:photosystem II stability/assembly factor-like uncharacterized protein